MNGLVPAAWDDGFRERQSAKEAYSIHEQQAAPFLEAAAVLREFCDPSLATTLRDDPIGRLNQAYRKISDGRLAIPAGYDLAKLSTPLAELLVEAPMQYRKLALPPDILGLKVLQLADCAFVVQTLHDDGGAKKVPLLPIKDSKLLFHQGKHLVGLSCGDTPPSEVAIPLLHASKLANLGPTDAEVLPRHCHPSYVTPAESNRRDRWATWGMSADEPGLRDPRPEVRNLMLRLLEKHAFPGARVCFAGCGGGEEIRDVCAEFGQRERLNLSISGFDSSETLLAQAQRRTPRGTDLRQLDFQQAVRSFGENQFDLVVGVGILDRLTLQFGEGVEALECFRRLLKPEGKALLVPEGPSLFTNEQLRQRGFDVLASWSFTELDAPFHVVQRSDRSFAPITDPLIDDLREWRKEPDWRERLKVTL